ncbi:cation:dicarboxylate symporter family transporter [Streptomyces sp. SID6139]|uniref:cation:dicarboxylate symporter family transporter n=1 Tax=Streptomyces sp. SID6139 TaxID=2690320 RepID=UPI00387ED7E3
MAMLVVTLLTSEGAAGVTGSSFTALAATVPHVPVGTLALIFGVSRFMSETRSLTSLAGNGVATLAAARWEDGLDEDRARSVLRGGRPYTPGLAPTAAPPASLAAGPNRFTFEACGPSPCRGILCPNTAAWTVWPLSGLDGVRLVERQHGEGGQPVVGGEAAAFHGGQTHGEVCVGLGSHSTDLLSGLGPEPLRAGDVLPLGAPTGRTALPGAAP